MTNSSSLLTVLLMAAATAPAAVAQTPDPQPISIIDLDDEMGGSGGGPEIQGRVGIWIQDSTNRPVANVIVRASWSGAVTGTTRCTTDSQGYCQMVSKSLLNEQGIYLVMTVRGYDNPEYKFDKKLNRDGDRDSNGTAIRIQR